MYRKFCQYDNVSDFSFSNFEMLNRQIHLDKKVPTGAGLGGGSSNAATALWAANQFSDCLATEKDLQEWSSEIGSDVPFFFSRGAAYCTGRGEVYIQTAKYIRFFDSFI